MSFLSRPTLKPTAVDPAAQDVEVPDPPDDSMSALCFAPNADYLAVASWNSQVRVYEVGQTIAGRASYSQAGPILDVCWTADGTSIISAGVDKAAHAYDLASGSSRQVAAHDAPIRSVRWLEQASLLVTASWDKTIKVRRVFRLDCSSERDRNSLARVLTPSATPLAMLLHNYRSTGIFERASLQQAFP